MFVCVYVYMYIHTYIYIHTYTIVDNYDTVKAVEKSAWNLAGIYVCIYTYIFVHACVYMHACIIYIYIHAYICICVCAYMHTYTLTHSLTLTHTQKKKNTEAMEILQQTVQKDPQHHLAYTYMAKCVYMSTKNVQKSEELLRRALQLQPQHMPSMILLSELMYQANKTCENDTYAVKHEQIMEEIVDTTEAFNNTERWSNYTEFLLDVVNMSQVLIENWVRPLPNSLEDLAAPRCTVDEYVFMVEQFEDVFSDLEEDPLGTELLQMLAQVCVSVRCKCVLAQVMCVCALGVSFYKCSHRYVCLCVASELIQMLTQVCVSVRCE